MALNCLYSLAKYGQQPHYIVATFEQQSLAVCQSLNLPCYNGTKHIHVAITAQAHTFGSQSAMALWWAKQDISLSLLRLGYTVHGSDADVVYFRPVIQSYQQLFDKMWCDGLWLSEESKLEDELQHKEERVHINMINAGVYALQPNNRTINLMRMWLLSRLDPNHENDQRALNRLHCRAYNFCTSRMTCISVKRHMVAAFYVHPTIFPETSCTAPEWGSFDPCDTRRLYVHYLCNSGWETKERSWNSLGLWLVDQNGAPLWSDGGANKGANGTKHAFLPCPGVAWPDESHYDTGGRRLRMADLK